MELIAYNEITQLLGIEMEYSMQADEFEIDAEPQSDEEIRRQLGWYLMPFNADEIDISVDAQAINDSQSR